jgi:hypothetical protein
VKHGTSRVERPTAPLNPLTLANRIVDVAVAPGCTVCVLGMENMLMSGAVLIVNFTIAERVRVPLLT